ncbi:MAG: winged helix-turn-helix domain-containing protein, partial [Thermoanaerobaculia bacterium]
MPDPTRLLFDAFELRLDSGELFRDGVPVGLQPQPAKVLELLASRSGEVVTREEIRREVWGESFVDFDASLNFCIKQIRRALEDSATSPRYIETLPRRGYRFLQPIQVEPKPPTGEIAVPFPEPPPAVEGPGPAMAVPKVAPEPPAHRARPRTRYPLPAMLAVAAMLLTLLILLIASRFQSPITRPRLAVLPLKCGSTDLAARQVCGGVTDALTAELARQLPRGVEVIAPTSLMAFEGSGKTPHEIGHAVGATYLLGGAVEPSGGQLKIAAVLSTVSGKPLWSQALNTELSEAPLVYLQIVRGVAGALRVPVPAAMKTVHKPPRQAYEAYLKGIYLRRQMKMDEAAAMFQEATLLDDRFALAFAQLALARVDQERSPELDSPATVAAARKAIQLDPLLAEGHLALGDVLFKDRLDWRRAGEEYRRALALAPGDAEVHYIYGKYLVALGRHDEAIAEVERARELDPASMAVQSDYAWFLYNARRYDEAIRQAHTTLELLNMTKGSLPNVAQYGRSWSYYVEVYGSRKTGDDATVLAAVKERMRELDEGDAVAGIRTVRDVVAWRRRYMQERARKEPNQNSFGVALTAVDAGYPGEALDALELMCRNGGENIMFNYVPVEPMFEPLHGNPRFEKVVDCTGLPKDAPVRRTL